MADYQKVMGSQTRVVNTEAFQAAASMGVTGAWEAPSVDDQRLQREAIQEQVCLPHVPSFPKSF
jgi:hypothetical protein